VAPTLRPQINQPSRWEQIIRQQASCESKQHRTRTASPPDIALCDDVGGEGEPRVLVLIVAVAATQLCRGMIELNAKEVTPEFVDRVQPVLSASVPARALICASYNEPGQLPVEIRVTSRADVSTANSAQDMPGRCVR
jgi:hypothetical protein